MKKLINLVGDLESIGFDDSIYKKAQSNVVGKAFVTSLYYSVLRIFPLSASDIIKIKNNEPFSFKKDIDGIVYFIKLYSQTDHKNNVETAVLGEVISDELKVTAFRFRFVLKNDHIHELAVTPFTYGGSSYIYNSEGLKYRYYNGTGDLLYSSFYRFNHHTYTVSFNKSKYEYAFYKDILLSFANKEKNVEVKFFKFNSSRRYKVSAIKHNSLCISFFYKGNVKSIERLKDDKIHVTVYYSTGNLKCTYSYTANTKILCGIYKQYDRKGDLYRKTPYKEGEIHGIVDTFKDSMCVSQVQYKHGKKDGLHYKLENGIETVKTYSKGRPIKRRK